MSQTKAQLLDGKASSIEFNTGSASSPTISFTGDTNTGIYSSGTDQVSIATGGTERLRVDANGQIEAVSLGSASSPTYSWTGDPNTGIYSPGADQVAISTNGTGRLFVDADGNVGTNGAPSTTANSFGYRNFELKGASTDRTGLLRFTDSAGTTAGTLLCNEVTGFQFAQDLARPITFFINNTERMRLDSSGRLGLGTSSPSASVHVYRNTTDGTVSEYRAENAGATGSYSVFRTIAGTAEAAFYSDAAGNVLGATGATLRTISNHPLYLGTNNTTRLTITNGGNVGIGSTVANSKLSIGNGASTNDGLTITFTGDNSTLARFYADTATGQVSIGGIAASYYPAFYSAGSERARIDTSGRLLVGTSSYAGNGKVAIAGGTGTNIALFDLRYNSTRPTAADTGLAEIRFGAADQTSNNAYAKIEAVTDGASSSDTDLPGRLVFSTTLDGASSPTERMRLTNQGAIWAASNGGVSTFGATTHYHGLVQNEGGQWVLGLQNNGGGGGLGFGLTINYSNTTPNNTGNTFIQGVDATAARFVVRSNGGIANYQANDVNLCDEREKKNIVNLESTWDCLKRWELKKFHYNEDADTDDLRYGVIAQQVAPHCPEVITDWVKQQAEPVKLDDDGNEIEPAKKEIVRMGVKEQQMMWMAINALQEAQLRIETLEAEVATLKAS